MKTKKFIGLFIGIVFILFLVGNFTPAYAKAAIIPKVQFIKKNLNQYTEGSNVSIVVNSPNYKGKVQYRAYLYNNSTKKTIDIWNTSKTGYYSSQSYAGNYQMTITVPGKYVTPGSYSIFVMIKRSGVRVKDEGVIRTSTFNVVPKLTTLSVQDIAKKNNAVLLLKVYDDSDNLIKSGSAFEVSSDGKIITNYHVIDGANHITAVASDGKEYEVTGVISYSVPQDIAVLLASDLKGHPYLNVGDSDKLSLGQDIVAIGSPLGLQNTVSTGIVSSFRTNIFRYAPGTKDIQISAPISPGSSGGALFDMYGNVVGITYAGVQDVGDLNFAIPINEIKPFLNSDKLKTFADVKSEIDSSYQNVKRLKFYASLSDEYRTLYMYNYNIEYTKIMLSEASTDYSENNSTDAFNQAKDYFNNVVDQYNSIQSDANDFIENAKQYNLDVSDMNDILSKSSQMIQYYKSAIDGLNNYFTSGNEDGWNAYVENIYDAEDVDVDNYNACNEGFYKYYMLLQQDAANDQDANVIKFYSRIARLYNDLDVLGNNIILYHGDMEKNLTYVADYNETGNLNNLDESMKELENWYNEVSDEVQSFTEQAKAAGMDLSDLNIILSKYKQSIDNYNKARTDLNKLIADNSTTNYNTISDNLDKTIDIVIDTRNTSHDSYNAFYKILQDYMIVGAN